MPGPYTLEKIENWASDFCLSDGLRPFSPALREAAGPLLVAFLTAACAARGVEPEDIEEPDVKAALLGSVARLAVPEAARREVPAICGAFLASLEAAGRLGGGGPLPRPSRAATRKRPPVRPSRSSGLAASSDATIRAPAAAAGSTRTVAWGSSWSSRSQGGLDVAAPVTGEKQVRATEVLGQISLRKKL